jgi:NifU-like protein involved in Fe-S cluster formation
MWEYTEKLKEHFFNPRNVGEIESPDGIGEVGSLACGDALKLTFKLDENGKIKDACQVQDIRLCKCHSNIIGINRDDKGPVAG